MMTPVQLAKESLEIYVKERHIISAPEKLPSEMQGEAGVFVSLKEMGQLRGCIGTFMPTRDNIAQEIIYNAIAAGTEDPRFYPISVDELEKLVYSVDILSPPESVDSEGDLDPQQYGVIVQNGSRRGLLLPMLEGVDTVEEQVSIAKQKAGIGTDEVVKLMRFKVVRYKV